MKFENEVFSPILETTLTSAAGSKFTAGGSVTSISFSPGLEKPVTHHLGHG